MNEQVSQSTEDLKAYAEGLQGIRSVKVYSEESLRSANVRELSPAVRRLMIRNQNRNSQALPDRG